jgi:hypothetical protein
MRFGILCGAGPLLRWQADCLAHLLAVPGVGAAVRFVWPGQDESVRGSRLFRRLNPPAGAQEPLEWPAQLRALPIVHLQSAAGGGPMRVSLDAIPGARLDFILSLSAQPVPDELIALPSHGVWVLCAGDWERYRGPACGFWEVYDNSDLSGAVLARLTTQSDTVIPLRRGWLRTRKDSYALNRDQLLTRCTHWPAQVCREILHGHAECLSAAPLRSHVAFQPPPTSLEMLLFASRSPVRLLGGLLSALTRSDHWNVGIVDQPITDFIHSPHNRPRVRWLPQRRSGEFVADPFGLVRDGKRYIFCEFLDYRDGVGRIAAVELSQARTLVPVQIGPQPPVHLSYPALIENEGRLLCIPESQAASEVALYELERFPDRWTRVATLISGAHIVDATVFRHDGRWWLAGAADGPEATFGSDLHLWYAPAISGPWTAHAANPVKTDVGSARPAGPLFEVDGVLYRPAQDSSQTYGARVIINRILTLTPDCFREEPVASVEPDPGSAYPDGLHTLCAMGDKTLVDGKRLAFSRWEFRRIIGRMLGRRVQRLARRLTGR